ncbi:hypothetical protein [Sutcliffiella rhizosphaerae]|uniref:Anti-sigma-X factor RsiX n=1 Tax=Sutcliffiella rhizosphaerae TaxID=2880967 RepID=A0ABN8AFP1_9BACI|nr:hypothetical protein [Sutcliffiella rhizosphaerae]CAG9622327.1 Anti-sigma-X factor RsiX [Sutcliffiella rhizosphaerae]
MRRRDKDQLEKLLNQMPGVKDDRDPKDIYQKIQPELYKKPRKSRFIPSLALAAALIILAMVTPFIINDMQMNLGLSGSESNAVHDDADSDMATMSIEEKGVDESKELIEEARIAEDSMDDDVDKTDRIDNEEIYTKQHVIDPNATTYIVPSINEQENYVVTVGARALETDGDDGTYIAPLTVLVANQDGTKYIDAFNAVRQNINYERYGTLPPMMNEGKSVTEEMVGNVLTPMVDIAGMNVGLSSHQNSTFENELRETFRWKYMQVQLSNNGEKLFDLGNKVYDKPIPIESNSKRAYYKYEVGAIPLLIPSQTRYTTLKDTLGAMKVAPIQPEMSKLEPSIPENIIIESIRMDTDNQVAYVKIADSSVLENNDETIFALEAIMMVAKEFQLAGIVFESNQDVQIGNITLNEEMPIPAAANPIPYNE